jgi:hypothetical protein
MKRDRMKKAALLLLGLGTVAGVTLPAQPAKAQDCSAYEVDSYTETYCFGSSLNSRQVWVYYLPSGCGGNKYVYGPWYRVGSCGPRF